MFDIRAIRETPDTFIKAWNRRNVGLGVETVSKILELDKGWRAATTAKQDAEMTSNDNSKLIGQAKGKKDEAEAARLMTLVADAKAAIEAAGAEEDRARKALDDILKGLPNLPLDEVPGLGDDAPSTTAAPEALGRTVDELARAAAAAGATSMIAGAGVVAWTSRDSHRVRVMLPPRDFDGATR